MTGLGLKPKKDLLALLACFAPIDTHGDVSLYRRMFLNPTLLKHAPAFGDNRYGHFLTDQNEKLLPHAQTLRAAFLLTDDEFNQISVHLQFDANTILTLEAISSIFRRCWLARKLKLSVKEFLLLTEFTDVDPFDLSDIVDPPILRLPQLISALQAMALNPAKALYLIWNQDISGKSAPHDSEVQSFARTLRSSMAAVDNEFVIMDDPDGQIARTRMALVYDNEATNRFFGLLDEKTVTDVPYSHDKPVLEQAISDAGKNTIAYDNLRKRMSYVGGVLPDALRSALLAVAGTSQPFKDAVVTLHAKTRAMFERFPELLPLYNQYVASNEPVEIKRAALLVALLGTLKPRRKREQVLQAIAAVSETESGFASALLDSQRDAKQILHQHGDVNQAALSDLIALESMGLSSHFYLRDTATGTVWHSSSAEAILDYSSTTSGKPKLPSNAGNPISGVWNGFLETPDNGFCNFHVDTDAGAVVTLVIDGRPIELAQNGNVSSNKHAVELRAGTLYTFSLTVEKMLGTMSLRWEAEGRGKELIPARYLYSAALIDSLRTTYVRFLKSVSLAQALKLTADELVHFSADAEYAIDGQGWLNSLVSVGGPQPSAFEALLKSFAALVDFARIKAEISPHDARLLTVLQNPDARLQRPVAQATPAVLEKPELLLLSLTGWDSDSLDALLTRFGKVTGTGADRSALKNFDTFNRVNAAFLMLKKAGISASALINAATNAPQPATVRAVQAALRARYEESDWLAVLKPINDDMREMQRDALVAYILHQMRADPDSAHIDTADKLFEYFLMDVQMAPCMKTSRIRLALSSVQLFIERCLMNLEIKRVSPGSIKPKQWDWMKNYRVWEANRKIFLWPENWSEPELRDDQSPFFKEAMSELLQSDITDDSASAVLLNYLSKLDEVAKLEPCGIHFFENDVEKSSDDLVYVVARTSGANRKYFSRRCEGGIWSPWEQIKLDIEDNPVVPVMWKGRLFLFWLRLLKEQPTLKPAMLETPDVNLTQIKTVSLLPPPPVYFLNKAILCWSEYYNGKWQSTRTSDVNRPAYVAATFGSTAETLDRSQIEMIFSEQNGALSILIGEEAFIFQNTHSLPHAEVTAPDKLPARKIKPSAKNVSFKAGTLNTSYYGGKSDDDYLLRDVLNYKAGGRVVQPWHPLKQPRVAPFFFEDGQHVFYVTTSERPNMFSINDRYMPGLITELPTTYFFRPLVAAQVQERPDPLGPVINGSLQNYLDGAGITHVVNEDAYIRKGILMAETVRFGDIDIGPTGSRHPVQQR